MKNVRRFIRLFAIIAVMLAPLTFASSAFGYPPGVSATLQVSTTSPHICESITVSGTGFNPSVQVKVYERNVLTKTTTTNASGAFSTSIKVVGPVGSQVIKAVDADGGTDSVTINVHSAGSACGGSPSPSSSVDPTSTSRSATSSAGSGSGGGGGGGGLANTGVAILALLLLALALLVAGITASRAGRARHRA